MELEPLARGKRWILKPCSLDDMEAVKDSFSLLINLLEDRDLEPSRVWRNLGWFWDNIVPICLAFSWIMVWCKELESAINIFLHLVWKGCFDKSCESDSWFFSVRLFILGNWWISLLYHQFFSPYAIFLPGPNLKWLINRHEKNWVIVLKRKLVLQVSSNHTSYLELMVVTKIHSKCWNSVFFLMQKYKPLI